MTMQIYTISSYISESYWNIKKQRQLSSCNKDKTGKYDRLIIQNNFRSTALFSLKWTPCYKTHYILCSGITSFAL